MANFKSVFSDAMGALESQVQANTSAEQSAVTLLQNLSTLIQSNASDPTAINALATQLKKIEGDPSIPGRAYYTDIGHPFCFYSKRQVNTWDKQSQYAMQSWYNSSM